MYSVGVFGRLHSVACICQYSTTDSQIQSEQAALPASLYGRQKCRLEKALCGYLAQAKLDSRLVPSDESHT